MTAQALPTEYPGLGLLFQQAPLMGFLQAGDMQRQADENNPRVRQRFEQDMNQQAAMNPLEQAYRQAQTEHMGATTNQTREQTIAAQLANQYTRGTQPGVMDAANAGNLGKVSKSQADQYESEGKVYGQLATRLKDSNLTPWEKANIVKSALGQRLGSHPGVEAGLVRHSNDLADWMEKLSNDSYERTTEARKTEAANTKEETKFRMQGENQIALEELKQTGRMEMSSLKMSLMPKKAETFDQLKARWTVAANAGDVQAQLALKNLYTNEGAMHQMAGLTGDALKTGILNMKAYAPAQPEYRPPQVPPAANPMTPRPGDRDIAGALAQQRAELMTSIADPNLPFDQREAKKRDLAELDSQLATMKKPVSTKIVVPPGFTPLGDGTFRTPDGRIVRPKQ